MQSSMDGFRGERARAARGVLSQATHSPRSPHRPCSCTHSLPDSSRAPWRLPSRMPACPLARVHANDGMHPRPVFLPRFSLHPLALSSRSPLPPHYALERGGAHRHCSAWSAGTSVGSQWCNGCAGGLDAENASTWVLTWWWARGVGAGARPDTYSGMRARAGRSTRACGRGGTEPCAGARAGARSGARARNRACAPERHLRMGA